MMFPNKERHWITGKYDYSINYDSWYQWIETYLYKGWQYSPLLWNIKDPNAIDNHNVIQLIYSTRDGDLKMVSIFITVNPRDEEHIKDWLKQQPWLSN
jgi:hypothetical protein